MVQARFRHVLYGILLLSLAAANWTWVVTPLHRWAVLHAVYSNAAIQRGNIHIVETFRPRSALFSNGERLDYGVWPDILAGIVWLSGFGIGAIALSPFVTTREEKQAILTRRHSTGE